MKFSESAVISARQELIFDFTQDYNNRLKWDSFLIKAELLDEAAHADKGVRARCVARNGWMMETQYVSYNRPNVVAVKMTRGPYLFKDFAASWTFIDIGNGNTKVSFTYSLKIRLPFLFIGSLVKYLLRRNVKQRLKGLKSTITAIEN